MFRTFVTGCIATTLLIFAVGAAYQQQCQYDTVVCPSVSGGECYAPDTALHVICSPVLAQPDCPDHLGAAACENKVWRGTPRHYYKCFKKAGTGKIKHVQRECYGEVPCIWDAATIKCEFDWDAGFTCMLNEWQVDDSQPLCKTLPPL